MEVNNNFQGTPLYGATPNITKRGKLIQSEDSNPAPGLTPDIKEKATEMLPKERKMGEFENKNWIGEAKDLQIGPDIRFAVKSKNPDFLKRIVWGPLTVAEYREVRHRLDELEKLSAENPNILKGKIIDGEDKTKEISNSNRSTIGIRV